MQLTAVSAYFVNINLLQMIDLYNKVLRSVTMRCTRKSETALMIITNTNSPQSSSSSSSSSSPNSGSIYSGRMASVVTPPSLYCSSSWYSWLMLNTGLLPCTQTGSLASVRRWPSIGLDFHRAMASERHRPCHTRRDERSAQKLPTWCFRKPPCRLWDATVAWLWLQVRHFGSNFDSTLDR